MAASPTRRTSTDESCMKPPEVAIREGGEVKAIDIARRVRDTVMASLQPYLDGG